MVIWSETARADLRAIHDFISHDSRHYAKQVARSIRTKTGILDRLPKLGKKVPEVGEENLRELSIYSYRIIYEIKEKDAFVLAIVHKRRDLQPEDIVR